MGTFNKIFQQDFIEIIFILIGAFVVNIAYRFWSGYMQKWLDDVKDKFYEKEQKKKIQQQTIIETLIEQGHYNLKSIVKRCQLKGYRDEYDDEDFMRILKTYHKIGGNTDSEVIEHNFLEIQSLPVLKSPKQIGSDLPNKDILKDMLDVYEGINNTKLSKEKVEHLKIILANMGILKNGEDLPNK